MVESFPFSLAVGAVLGYLASIGVGGGSLLILWLTLVLGMEQGTARAINLMFFIAAAIAVSIFRFRKGTLSLKNIWPAILGGCAAAAVFSWISNRIDVDSLKVWFGILLLATGLRELFYRPRKAK